MYQNKFGINWELPNLCVCRCAEMLLEFHKQLVGAGFGSILSSATSHLAEGVCKEHHSFIFAVVLPFTDHEKRGFIMHPQLRSLQASSC